MPTAHGISVFFPAYNDAPSLPGLLKTTFETLASTGLDHEVIVVNDGSADDTAQVLEAARARYGERLRIITHPVNRGYGGALRSGIAAATRDLVFYTDGDGQYDVSELPLLLARMSPGIGLVNGYKLTRHDPWHRIWIGRTYNAIVRTLFGIRLRDVDCDFRLMRRELIQSIPLTSTSGTICLEMVRKIERTGCGIEQVGVHHLPRLHGRSQFFRLGPLVRTFRQLTGLYFRLVILGR